MRVALIRSSGSSAWQSCISITHNLARAYEGIPGLETREFALDPSAMGSQVHEIYDYAPDVLAVIDYGSFQPAFLESWTDSNDSCRIPIFLHCFGDFPLAAPQWVKLAPKLLGHSIRFFGASDASAELITELLSDETADSSVDILPFPIDGSNFRPSPSEGAALRRSLGIAAREFLLLYTGRISLQKNVATLTRLVRDYSLKRETPLTLAFAGDVDDIGADFLGIELSKGFYREHFFSELSASLDGAPLRIAMLGNLGPEDLRRAYNAADAFVSLSMHHDEDFGMSPGEALCCGTPVILSGWGGFHSFPAHLPEDLRAETAQLIPLKNSGENVSVRAGEFFEALDRRRVGPPASELRARLAAGAAASLSIEAVRLRLKQSLAREAPSFAGFSQLFEKLARLTLAPGRFRSRRFDDPNYRRLYAPYFGPASLKGPKTAKNRRAGSLDFVKLGTDKLEIHAWCADLAENRAPVEVGVFKNSQRLPGAVVFKTRPDVQEELGRKFDRSFKPGFELQLPKGGIGKVVPGDVFSVYAYFERGLAVRVGKFRLA